MIYAVPMPTLSNVARNAMRAKYFPVMTHKVYERLRYRAGQERDEATDWAASAAVSLDAWATAIDAELWRETTTWASGVHGQVDATRAALAAEGVNMGGPGCIELLYFLTRRDRPETCIETGVAAGWSTLAMLAAMEVNGTGRLLSSDFPLFRLSDPEKYIGYAVREELRGRWTLRTDGDRKAVPALLAQSSQVGLAHYDSDKSKLGRRWFVDTIWPHLAPRAAFVMDDINDDLFFRDTFGDAQPDVFHYEGKYVGMVLRP